MSIESTIDNIFGEVYSVLLKEAFSDYLGCKVYKVELNDGEWQVYINGDAIEEASYKLANDDSVLLMQWEV